MLHFDRFYNSGCEISDGDRISEQKIKLGKEESGRGLIRSTIPILV
jgi:hypothetical protein